MLWAVMPMPLVPTMATAALAVAVPATLEPPALAVAKALLPSMDTWLAAITTLLPALRTTLAEAEATLSLALTEARPAWMEILLPLIPMVLPAVMVTPCFTVEPLAWARLACTPI